MVNKREKERSLNLATKVTGQRLFTIKHVVDQKVTGLYSTSSCF